MSRGETIQDMIDQLRSVIEEENTAQIKDDRDLLPLINNAHKKAFEILAQIYPEPIMTFQTFDVSSQVWTLPENIYQDKVILMVWVDGNDMRIVECKKSSPMKFIEKQQNVCAGYPTSYIVAGRKIKFSSPPPAGRLTVFYLTELNTLVRPIAVIDELEGTDKLYFSELDAEYSPSADRLDGYLNVIDGQTGLIKASVQVKTLGTDYIEIREIPDRTRVLNRNISTNLTTLVDDFGEALTIEADDYLCAITGTCVIPYMSMVESYIRQDCIAALKRNQGFAYDVDQQLVAQFRSDMQKAANSSRDNPITIRRRNSCWNSRVWGNI